MAGANAVLHWGSWLGGCAEVGFMMHQHRQLMVLAQEAAGGDGPAHHFPHKSNMLLNQSMGQPLPSFDEPRGGGARLVVARGGTCMVEGGEGVKRGGE